MKNRMNPSTILIAFAFVAIGASNLPAQQPTQPVAGPEYDVYKKDVGHWDVECKMPGQTDTTKGTEINKMLGDFWLVTEFEGKMFGTAFQGRGFYGYDQEKKQYIGTWIDSFGSPPMNMTGTYDKEKQTLTMVGMAAGMDGKLAEHTMTTNYQDGKRIMTMHVQPKGGEKSQMFEMVYIKKK